MDGGDRCKQPRANSEQRRAEKAGERETGRSQGRKAETQEKQGQAPGAAQSPHIPSWTEAAKWAWVGRRPAGGVCSRLSGLQA